MPVNVFGGFTDTAQVAGNVLTSGGASPPIMSPVNGVVTLTSTATTVTALQSGCTFLCPTSVSGALTLIANPAGISYRYRVMLTGGGCSITPASGGTTYFAGGSTTYAISNVNLYNGCTIEFSGIPGTSNYVITMQYGNWQAAGSSINAYSSLAYPGTAGQVFMATGNSGLAAFSTPMVEYSFNGCNVFNPPGASATLPCNGINATPRFWIAPAAGQVRSISGYIGTRATGNPGGGAYLAVLKNQTYTTNGSSALAVNGTNIGQSALVNSPGVGVAAAYVSGNVISTSNTFAAGDRLLPVVITNSSMTGSYILEFSVEVLVQHAII